MPLIWNSRVSHLLGNNFGLAKRILESQRKKLTSDQIKMIDNVFLEQINMGIIQEVKNIDDIVSNSNSYSFLAHMPVFRPEKPSSPCRVVFLSNLNAKGSNVISHNQAMLAGPPLNRKLTTALLNLRFNKYVLCFDLKKAFLQIELSPADQHRLLFLWYKDVTNGDYSLVTYKNVRLSFGLRCSPTILMLALYKILMIDTEKDSAEIRALKKQIYSLIYVDNGACTSNDSLDLKNKFEKLDSIFNPYKFELQQFVTNSIELQTAIDKKEGVNTEIDTKLLGVRWDRISDTLATKQIKLNEKAASKRQILKSIAENFDPEGYNLPVLNRARLFMHRLQLKSELGWDSILGSELLQEWRRISVQANGGESLKVPRYLGKMDHEFDLIAFTDSSKDLYGTVIYIYNRTENTVGFLRGKNKVINKQLKQKSIPTLEFLALSFGAEVLLEVYNELTGPDCVETININNLYVYTDSYVALNWLNNYNHMQKLRNLSVFTMNRLAKIVNLCKKEPITFKFVAGFDNPSDFVTREISEKRLKATNYLRGPEFLTNPSLCNGDMIEVQLPNKIAEFSKADYRVDQGPGLFGSVYLNSDGHKTTYDTQLERFSKWKSLLNSYVGQLRFINNVRKNLKMKKSFKFNSMHIIPDNELRSVAMRLIIKFDQATWFPQVLEYFNNSSKNTAIKDIPPIITQLNLALDKYGVIRVKSKLYPRMSEEEKYAFPVLISQKSRLAELIISEYHERLGHANRFTVLSEVRKKIWIPRAFLLVKRLTSDCLLCKRLHGRVVRLSKNCYRDFRVKPEMSAFKNIFLDYLGPFECIVDSKKKERKKVWLLVVCCLWSRAIKIHICYDYSASEFLKALQKQIFEYGLFSLCMSDAGTPILGGVRKIKDYIFNNRVIQEFFVEQNIDHINFSSYPKGNHTLGGLIETCNRMIRKLLYGCVRNLILTLSDMHFLTVQVCSLLNKRPLVLKETLRNNSDLDVPQTITPEMLIFGRPLSYLNIIPELYPNDVINIDITNIDFEKELEKLKKASQRLCTLYEDQFLQDLLVQSVQKKAGFKPIKHRQLKIGDLVLIKDMLLKPHQYPIGRVIKVVKNIINEVTEVTLIKANRETVRRHVSSVIPLLSLASDYPLADDNDSEDYFNDGLMQKNNKVQRKAAVAGLEKIKKDYKSGVV